ncbi:MAG: hypothetical protein ACLFN0_03180 [Thermovirgaceae bacterium]
MHVREKIWILAALLLTTVDILLPYTIFRKEGSWLFWIVLSAVVLAGGIAYTASWSDPDTRNDRGNTR